MTTGILPQGWAFSGKLLAKHELVKSMGDLWGCVAQLSGLPQDLEDFQKPLRPSDRPQKKKKKKQPKKKQTLWVSVSLWASGPSRGALPCDEPKID